MKPWDSSAIVRCVALTVGIVLLQGCSKPQSAALPPHALDDAAAASQRASEAMKGSGAREKKEQGGVQSDGAGSTP